MLKCFIIMHQFVIIGVNLRTLPNFRRWKGFWFTKLSNISSSHHKDFEGATNDQCVSYLVRVAFNLTKSFQRLSRPHNLQADHLVGTSHHRHDIAQGHRCSQFIYMRVLRETLFGSKAREIISHSIKLDWAICRVVW